MKNFTAARALVAPAAIILALGFSACGSNDDKVKAIQKQGTVIQQQAADVQAQSAKLAQQVKDGKITQAEADAKLDASMKKVSDSADKTASDAIDVVKGTSGVPDDAKKALDEAQQQIDAP
jgi:major membrane immunogen (membrane-anchored lipoprotein)